MSETNTPNALDITPEERIRAVQALEEQLTLHHDRIPKIIRLMIDNARSHGKPAEALALVRSLKECNEIIIDVAYKLAPYQSPKLESIAIKSEVEHKFVIRVPQQASDVNEWMKAVGATRKITQPGFGSGDVITDARDIIVERDGPEEEYLEPGEPPTIN